MLRELLDLFKTDSAAARMGEGFGSMLSLAYDVTLVAGTHYFDQAPSAEAREELVKRDVKVNKLQRQIRKQIISHLTLAPGGADASYGLLLMSLVKDVERIGDYAKNLSEIYDEGGAPLPGRDDDVVRELREIREIAESVFRDAGDVFAASDPDRAHLLLAQGQAAAERADALIPRIAAGPYDAATTVTLVLGTRYYKRIAAHLMNVLSGVVMPLHKLDYYDEDAFEKIRQLEEESASGESA